MKNTYSVLVKKENYWISIIILSIKKKSELSVKKKISGLSFGFNYGYAINPARDFGPRLFTAIQWGRGVFTLVYLHFLVYLE